MRALTVLALTCAFTTATPAATIAVLDTGVDLVLAPELEPFIQRPAFNAIDGTTNVTDTSPDRHGSLVAAYAISVSNRTARVLPVKVSTTGAISVGAAIRGVNFAASRPEVRVLNISYGGGPFVPESFRALAGAVNRGKLVVMAAGNQGAPGPVQGAQGARLLQQGGIAVGAIDNTGVIRPYSNRAGDNKDFYVVAQDDPLNLGVRGTSFSAPVVSGLAARIFDRSPHLTGKQVGAIMLRTAIDLGPPGIDRTYGRGAVNPQAALSPVGTAGVPMSAATHGPLAMFTTQGIGAGAPVNAALAENSRSLENVLILDEYERGFDVNLAAAVENADRRSRLRRLFPRLERDVAAVHIQPDPGLSMRIWHSLPRPAHGRSLETAGGPVLSEPETSLALNGDFGGALDYEMHLNRPPQSALTELVPDGAQFVTGGYGGAQFAGFGAAADSGALHWAVDEDVRLSFGSVHTRESEGYNRDSLANRLSAAWQIGERGALMVQAGRLHEDGSLLGGSSSGAFSVAGTDSRSLLLGGRWALDDGVSLFGYYGRARSRSEASTLSLIDNVSSLESETFGAGLVADNLFRPDDRLGLSVNRPLRVIDGHATLSVPVSRDLAGNIATKRERVSLAPDAAETNLETYYYFNPGRRTRVGAHLVYTRNPDHSSTAPDSMAVFATLSTAF